MEVAEKRKNYLKAIVLDPGQMEGRWELKIDVKDMKSWGGRQIGSYPHPLTGEDTPLFDINGNQLQGFMIEKPYMFFNPDRDMAHRRIIDWLLAHPEVGVEGLTLTNAGLIGKVSNPKIHLKNLDRQEMAEVDDEDTIDAVIGRLSDDTVNGISLERFRYLLAYFNLPYYDLRYISNKSTEKKFLRKKLKTFARGISSDGQLNANKITEVLDNIDNLKYGYELKEMLRLNIIKESYGSYKFNNVPLGSTNESVILWMKNNLEIYAEMVSQLYPLLKQEGFQFKTK